MRRKLRVQGVESSRATAMLFMFRLGGMALFAQELQVVDLVAAALSQRKDMIHLTTVGEGIAAAVALVFLPFQEIDDICHGSVLALFYPELIDRLVHQSWHGFSFVHNFDTSGFAEDLTEGVQIGMFGNDAANLDEFPFGDFHAKGRNEVPSASAKRLEGDLL